MEAALPTRCKGNHGKISRPNIYRAHTKSPDAYEFIAKIILKKYQTVLPEQKNRIWEYNINKHI